MGPVLLGCRHWQEDERACLDLLLELRPTQLGHIHAVSHDDRSLGEKALPVRVFVFDARHGKRQLHGAPMP